MKVVKRDGTTEDIKIEKILHAVTRACRGIGDVIPIEVAKQTISGLHDGSTTKELDALSINNAVMLIGEEPNYSKVASRMLSESIWKEVGRGLTFRDYVQSASELGLLSDHVYGLSKQNLDSIEYAIRHERDDLFEYFGLKTVADRYLLRHPKTRKLLERPQWLFMRVALGLSQTVEEAIEFYDLISRFFYMPATPTLFNSGTRFPQMSSCYLLTVGEDSLEGIYKTITDCAYLSKYSGGLGVDFTPVRASGSLIRGTNGLSNGAIPFLKVFDSSVHAVNQGGKRKGAAAVYLEPWHADIEAFLELRNNTGAEERRTHHLNLALWVPDLFMKRVEQDGEWSLFSPDDVPLLLSTFGPEFEAHYQAYEEAGKAFKRLPARALYARMLQCLAETGNGWICFKDRANQCSAQTKDAGNVIRSSNLCTEILELASKQETAVCNLGSINVSAFVGKDGNYQWEELRRAVNLAVTFLDRVVDINFYPTSESKYSNQRWRPVGLGLMGLQDLLFKMRLPFGSAPALALSTRISETIYHQAILTSMALAKKSGAFPMWEHSRYVDGKLQVQLAKQLGGEVVSSEDWDALAKQVQQTGLRNSLLVAIAPTATIASIVGCYESIEPQVSNFFKRETLSGEFIQVNRYLISDLKKRGLWNTSMRAQIIEANGSIQGIQTIPEDIRELYRTVWEIPQKDLIDMASERGAFICQSQSLNLFMENPNTGKLSSMYMYAWKKGLKTTYYLRSRARTTIQKTTTAKELVDGVSCSLENPESCESCQ